MKGRGKSRESLRFRHPERAVPTAVGDGIGKYLCYFLPQPIKMIIFAETTVKVSEPHNRKTIKPHNRKNDRLFCSQLVAVLVAGGHHLPDT